MLYSLLSSGAFVFLDTEGEGAGYLGLLFLVSGFAYYWFIYARYRNQDKRHHHESETKSVIENVLTHDRFLKHRRGLRNADMAGRNDLRIEGALNKPGIALLGKNLPISQPPVGADLLDQARKLIK